MPYVSRFSHLLTKLALIPHGPVTVQFSLFLYPNQAQNTSSGIQGLEATAVAVI